MAIKFKEVNFQIKEVIADLESQFKVHINVMKEKIKQYKSDIDIKIRTVEDLVGVNNPHLSDKTTMHSLNLVVKMIVTYLMSRNIAE